MIGAEDEVLCERVASNDETSENRTSKATENKRDPSCRTAFLMQTF